ncbi:metal ABC transporter substrate-binding protein [Humibacillus xanthopallidus]|uniref:Zinc transport system substrate-binding protein n=1 Tax=Humibacillus xanthopallidus TaxID=412689 RepID=A0A543HWR1_9MICO|nr:metal ABC transporter substrate-binding protein [Humibacillus xanthopallidus]TQM62811.1 zinc transport system substrate-binding protein [Humibacillus xanthopallidus]
MISAPRRRALTALTAVGACAALVLSAAACSSDSGAGSGSAEGAVVTSFYPLQFATQQITGSALPVTSLTKPGAEPHDLELAPQDVAGLTKARLVIYADGFQPAVDDAMAQVDQSRVLDVADAAALTLPAAESGHAGESAADHAEHSADDPHFWLDPQRYAAVAKVIGARLAKDDPAKAATYTANTDAFVAKLTALDGEFAKGLSSCTSKVLVTSHAAFGYLAKRYGLEQHGISGISPEAEPSAAALKEISDLVRTEGVTTIFQETLVEPKFAQTVATSTGATLSTLDPIEGITTDSAGKDYFEVMRSNLRALQQGLGCS